MFGAAVALSEVVGAQVSDTLTHAIDSSVTKSDSLYVINKIIIAGNKKTKESIILREIPIKEGEAYSIPILVKKFEDSRRQLMNTTLFHSVVVAAKNFNGNQLDVSVEVRERWYLFPLPYFKPVDRNLNQWLVEQKASLSRVNYGIKLLYGNATGRNDKLKLYLFGGYTKQVSLSYDRLYFDKKMRWGARITAAAGKNREINYNTINDKQAFLKYNNAYLRNFFNSQLELTYRRAIKTRHSFGIGYTYEKVHDTVTTLNPSYFQNGKKYVSYPEIFYRMTYYDVDYIPYPTKGFATQVSVAKKGFNHSFNLWELSARSLVNWHIFPKTYFGIEAFGSIKLPLKQPYFNQRFLGYQDVFLQGYEYYVIDGVAGGYLKATLSKEFLNFKVRIPPMKKGREAEYIPFRIIGKVFGNSGYVHNPQPGENTLIEKMLYSGGVGIDILTFYDVTFKLEWTFNQLGQNGLFLHRKTIF
ncbi:MAG TPA: POTRA domain-containing protein [Chitinophagaceae bacterium]|nr:POTRA domain-containing protein [Chitinophagaceae bacterium]